METNTHMTNKADSAKDGGAEIYVVDDEPMLLELASVILEPLGYRIRTFRSAEVAIDEFKSARPQPALIITDYAMHTMNGLELIEACRRIRPGQKTLLVSGTVGPDIFQDTPIRPDRFLAKPYQAKQLVDAVKSILPD
jgi:two-component system, cell cycle sensor histidine kinase and response regulator CckA